MTICKHYRQTLLKQWFCRFIKTRDCEVEKEPKLSCSFWQQTSQWLDKSQGRNRSLCSTLILVGTAPNVVHKGAQYAGAQSGKSAHSRGLELHARFVSYRHRRNNIQASVWSPPPPPRPPLPPLPSSMRRSVVNRNCNTLVKRKNLLFFSFFNKRGGGGNVSTYAINENDFRNRNAMKPE